MLSKRIWWTQNYDFISFRQQLKINHITVKRLINCKKTACLLCVLIVHYCVLIVHLLYFNCFQIFTDYIQDRNV